MNDLPLYVPLCLICGKECRVMAYRYDKVCCQRCYEAKASPVSNGHLPTTIRSIR